MSSFFPNTAFERSRWRLLAVLAIQAVATVLIAERWDEKVALVLVGAVSLVAVLTKRPWWTAAIGGRIAVFALLGGLGATALICGVAAFNSEQLRDPVTGHFFIWLAPLAAAVIAIFDFHASIKALNPAT
jgi:hypothetical protein